MNRKLLTLALMATLTGLSVISCGNKGTNSSSEIVTPQASPTPPKSEFEERLEYVRKGQYTYVWVFARKDSKPFDKEDGAFLRTNAHQVVDWVMTDDGKKVIAGTNFDLAEGNLELIKKRFIVEDYTSK